VVRERDRQVLHDILETRDGFDSRERLFSEPARAAWTLPDVRPLPALK